ncbi:MAG: LPS export ABC transporter permease LptG [Rhodospirillales bacterium]|nr:LPS export ABC transporter permease LptG [Rhodospirillales bacterium]
MRLSQTLSLYIARHYAVHFAVMLALFVFLIFVFDVVELMRRAAGKPGIGMRVIFEMAMLKFPHAMQMTFPFAVLFGSMVTFWRMTRSHELVVTRSAGVSAWQFLMPVLAVTMLIGLFRITAINPFSAIMLARYERLDATFLKAGSSALTIAGGGVWLRQGGSEGQVVLRSSGISVAGSHVEIKPVIAFLYRGTDRFAGRIDADSAVLGDGYWDLRNVWLYRPNETTTFAAAYRLPSELTLARIQDSFAPPETMSFWDLPGFIDSLKTAGFSALRHRLHLHSLLAAPFLMMAMVLLAATFTLRHVRHGGTPGIIGFGVMTGFLVYFFSDVSLALGLSSGIPVMLAAWTPAGVAGLIGIALLLHLEDG